MCAHKKFSGEMLDISYQYDGIRSSFEYAMSFGHGYICLSPPNRNKVAPHEARFVSELALAFSSGSGSDLMKRGADLCQLTLTPARPQELISQWEARELASDQSESRSQSWHIPPTLLNLTFLQSPSTGRPERQAGTFLSETSDTATIRNTQAIVKDLRRDSFLARGISRYSDIWYPVITTLTRPSRWPQRQMITTESLSRR